MPNTKLTKKTLSNHYHYSRLMYIAIIAIAWMLGDLLYSANEYRSPNERKVDIELVGMYAAAEKLDGVANIALAAGQDFERRMAVEEGLVAETEAEDYTPPLEAVSFFPINYDPNNSEDVYGVQKFFLTIAAQEGDIYFAIKPVMEELIESGIVIPLDEYIERGILKPGNRDLSEVTYPEPALNEGEESSGISHVYALQATPLYGFLGGDEIIYNNLNTYMVITSFAKNPDTVAAVMQSIMDQMEIPKPEWLEGLG